MDKEKLLAKKKLQLGIKKAEAAIEDIETRTLEREIEIEKNIKHIEKQNERIIELREQMSAMEE